MQSLYKQPHKFPPATHDNRPERADHNDTFLESLFHKVNGRIKKLSWNRLLLHQFVRGVGRAGAEVEASSDDDLQCYAAELGEKMSRHGLLHEHVVRSFALVREVSSRVLGMRHYDCQLKGGLVLLRGMCAEMETGEGKTLTATLAAAAAGLAGVPVHIISVNDYLTARDAEKMTPLYRALGLRVGCVVHGLSPEQRRHEYQADITYVTNKELVFDYLRDHLTIGSRENSLRLQAEYLHSNQHRAKKVLQRGLIFGIVDEADSVLIDEARTPLIISGSAAATEEKTFLEQALVLAGELGEEDYKINRSKRTVQLTPKGKKRVQERATQMGALWEGMVRRESTVSRALSAIHLFHRNQQYLVRDEKIQIVDEFTGRVMADRSWEQGLHQLIELKEGCELTKKNETLAKISYQRFFRRYLYLSGMTGTAKEVADELWSVYGLHTCKIPPNRKVKRVGLPTRIYSTKEKKLDAVVKRISEIHQKQRPILIGTRSVAASLEVSLKVEAAGLKHQVLNADQDAQEAKIISRAGQAGAITIATNMAGRGTDILLDEGVAERGGLHVIATEIHEAARIDRQLYGRAGRQGDRGSYEAILSFEDALIVDQAGMLEHIRFDWLLKVPFAKETVSRWLFHRAQKKIENYHSKIRDQLFRRDQAQGNLLSFSGRLE